jgi:2-polyprenyl-3-methyl-5-hydroxy-6-metoxy-1,4-benzoquinol methylase/GT2 family glycosyltransferase
MGNVPSERLAAESPAGVQPSALPFDPHPVIASSGALQNDADLAQCHGKRIGILIVTYNAVSTLTKVLKRITPHVWANVEEVAVFDDASQDDTYELALGLKALRALPKLTVLKHTQNLGYGGNQKAGYAYFIEKGFDIVVLLHGDGQYAPEILAHLYHPIVASESDAVFGSRMMKTYGGPLRGGMPLYKYVGNRILSVFENSSLDLNLTEFHSGYRAYNLHALQKLDFSKMTDDFHFDTEIIIKLHHQHYRISEVPIPTYYGTEICYVNGMKYARDVFRAVRRYKQTRASMACYPEFQEYFTHYPVKVSKYSSHYYVGQLVGTQRNVLDLGCGEGAVAAELQSNGNRVTGVDLLAEASNSEALEQYFRADLEEGIEPVIDALQGKRFDCVLLLDVLEHLHRPERLLQQCHEVLEPDGELIISMPNVAHLSVRLLLLLGKFDYTQRGILDKTHLRFFTRKTARNLVSENGYEIRAEKFTVTPLELIFGMAADRWLMKTMNRCLAVVTNLLPGLFAYQIMFVARTAPRKP